ncbi:hypothetical protein B0H12DRAFT_1069552 [Mycena haematopus]|nr:hypothetical protein B0H12DRAFT_1069552 [Mycena haematopus]
MVLDAVFYDELKKTPVKSRKKSRLRRGELGYMFHFIVIGPATGLTLPHPAPPPSPAVLRTLKCPRAGCTAHLAAAPAQARLTVIDCPPQACVAATPFHSLCAVGWGCEMQAGVSAEVGDGSAGARRRRHGDNGPERVGVDRAWVELGWCMGRMGRSSSTGADESDGRCRTVDVHIAAPRMNVPEMGQRDKGGEKKNGERGKRTKKEREREGTYTA